MTPVNKKPLIGIAVFAVFVLCAYQPVPFEDVPNDPVYNNLDKSVKPGTNFFQYANGGWLKKNPIPPAYSSWGIGNQVQEEIRERLRKINEDALNTNSPKGSAAQKIGDFYYSGLDSAGIEKSGLSPLADQLDLIDQAKDRNDILNIAALLTTSG